MGCHPVKQQFCKLQWQKRRPRACQLSGGRGNQPLERSHSHAKLTPGRTGKTGQTETERRQTDRLEGEEESGGLYPLNKPQPRATTKKAIHGRTHVHVRQKPAQTACLFLSCRVSDNSLSFTIRTGQDEIIIHSHVSLFLRMVNRVQTGRCNLGVGAMVLSRQVNFTLRD